MIETISIAMLEKSLSEQKNKCLLLYGPSGIGKTSIALNFSMNMIKKKKWICLWLNLDTFLREDNNTIECRIRLIKNEFRSNPDTKYLIILDNLNEVESIKSILKNLSNNVSIIATSVTRNVLGNFAYEIKVDYFTEDQARSFFSKKINKELSNQEYVSLENFFKYDKILPYDLNLLISELNNDVHVNLNALLERYQDLCEEISKNLYERISRISPRAIEILVLLSNPIYNGHISFNHILKSLNTNRSTLEKDVHILEINSIIEISTKLNEKFLSIHPRTQEMIKRFVKPYTIQNESEYSSLDSSQSSQDDSFDNYSTSSVSSSINRSINDLVSLINQRFGYYILF